MCFRPLPRRLGFLTDLIPELKKARRLFPYPREVNGVSYEKDELEIIEPVVFPYPFEVTGVSYESIRCRHACGIRVSVPSRGGWGFLLRQRIEIRD